MIDLKRKHPKLAFSLAEALVVMLVVMLLTLAASPMITKKRARLKKNTVHGEWICVNEGGKNKSVYIHDGKEEVSNNGCVFPVLPSGVKFAWVELFGGGGGGSQGSVKPWDNSGYSYDFGEPVDIAGTYDVVFNYTPSHKAPELDFDKILLIEDKPYDAGTYEKKFVETCKDYSKQGPQTMKLDRFINTNDIKGVVTENNQRVYAYCKRMSYSTHACYKQLFAPEEDYENTVVYNHLGDSWSTSSKNMYFNSYYPGLISTKNYQMAPDTSERFTSKYSSYNDTRKLLSNDLANIGLSKGCLPVDHRCFNVHVLNNGTISDFAERVCRRMSYLYPSSTYTLVAHGSNYQYYSNQGTSCDFADGGVGDPYVSLIPARSGSHYISFYKYGSPSQALHRIVPTQSVGTLGAINYAQFEPCSPYLASEGDYCISASYKNEYPNYTGSDLWALVSFVPFDGYVKKYNLEWREDIDSQYGDRHRFVAKFDDLAVFVPTTIKPTSASDMRDKCIEELYGIKNPTWSQIQNIQKTDGNCYFDINNGSYDGVMYANPVNSECVPDLKFPVTEYDKTSLKLQFKVQMLPGEKLTISRSPGHVTKQNNLYYPQKVDSDGVISRNGDDVKIYHHKAVRNGNSLTYQKVLVAEMTGVKVHIYDDMHETECKGKSTCDIRYGNLKGYKNSEHGRGLDVTPPVNLKYKWHNGYNGTVNWNVNDGKDGYSTTGHRFVSSSGCPGQNGFAQATMVSIKNNNPEVYAGSGGIGESDVQQATQGEASKFGGHYAGGGAAATGYGKCQYKEEPSPNPYDTSLSLGGKAGSVSTPNGEPQRDYNLPMEDDIDPRGRWAINNGGNGTGGMVRVSW